jgi:hypothetical protein
MELNNKRGSIIKPKIIVGNKHQSKIVFEGTKKQHKKWLDESKFKKGTIHHVYTDKGGDNVSYFRMTKK